MSDDLTHLRSTLVKFGLSFGPLIAAYLALGQPFSGVIMVVVGLICFFGSSSRIVSGFGTSFKKLDPEPRNLEIYWQKPLGEITPEEIAEYRRAIFLRDLPDGPVQKSMRSPAFRTQIHADQAGK